MTNKLVLCAGAAAAMCIAGTANAQLSWSSALPGTWMDISTTGAALSLGDDGEVDITSTASNSVFGAGVARVGSNGAVRFAGAGLGLSFGNSAIPSTGLFGGDQSLAPFWDDINTAGGTNGEIYWENVGGTLVVQWEAVDFFGGGVDVATFQLQVHSSGPALAQLLYRDIEGARAAGGGSATIGYQAGGIQNDAQFSFNTASVTNGTVLSLVPAPGTAVLLGLGGLMATRRRRA